MGAGRKMETVVIQNNLNPHLTWNSNPHSARNLGKNDLAGVIFGCKNSTYKECLFKQLFGLPAPHIQYVQNVTPGMPVFLFNYSDRTLHGVFEATSSGQMYINRYAWTLDGQEVTPFPAQVRVKVLTQCRALSENQYKPILARNYLEHEPNHLWFELDKMQTDSLISLFLTSVVSPNISVPPTAAKWGTLFRNSFAPIAHQKDCISRETSIDMNQGLCITNGTVRGEEISGTVSDQDLTKEQENGNSEKKWSSLFETQSIPFPSKECEDSTSEGRSTMSEDDPPILSGASFVNEVPVVTSDMTDVAEAHMVVSTPTCLAEEVSSEVNSDLRAAVNKLIQEMEEIKELHSRQTQKIQNLERELEEANSKLRSCEFHNHESGHSESSLSAKNSEERQFENQEIYQSILLVGGFDGSSWLQNLDSYCPFEDVMRPLAHMKSVRSYASAVELDGGLYVLGGGYGSCWHDTVESYNLKCHQWVTCPSLTRKKGSLAAAALGGKIFAIGGGNATECFSEVEVLDLYAGKWIVTRSMMHERFSPAVAELNGMLYVAGGYDGHQYLSSVERLDPRAYSWTRLKRMNSRRGCHSLTVMNEKLYAIGGYDGTRMVPTVEVFEPRMGSWTMSESMTYARGYMGTVNFGEKIYVIGGMQENNDILDTVECYSEGERWKSAQLKTMGKRCFFSAVAV